MKRKKITKGSAADHLANERTFLAWIRTAIGIIGLGFVVEKSSNFLNQINGVLGPSKSIIPEERSYVIGVLLVVLGSITIILAMIHYHRTEKMLERGLYDNSTLLIKTTATLILVFSLLLASYLVIIPNKVHHIPRHSAPVWFWL
ncbi:YidH family protein [Pedobacter jamesrossensis]|uniref:YidH family protein n=1 Tax=Pedobacter jamesrossensis TaxID=1908238 RepID=A0ABV8NHP9_9SPHI